MYITTKKFILIKKIDGVLNKEHEELKNLKIFLFFDIEVGYNEYGMLLAGFISIPNKQSIWISNPFFILHHFMLLEEWREQQIDKILENE